MPGVVKQVLEFEGNRFAESRVLVMTDGGVNFQLVSYTPYRALVGWRLDEISYTQKINELAELLDHESEYRKPGVFVTERIAVGEDLWFGVGYLNSDSVLYRVSYPNVVEIHPYP